MISLRSPAVVAAHGIANGKKTLEGLAVMNRDRLDALITAYTLTTLCAFAGVNRAIVRRWRAGDAAPSDRRRVVLDCAYEIMRTIESQYDSLTLQSWIVGRNFYGGSPGMALREIAMGTTLEADVERICINLVDAARNLAL